VTMRLREKVGVAFFATMALAIGLLWLIADRADFRGPVITVACVLLVLHLSLRRQYPRPGKATGTGACLLSLTSAVLGMLAR